MNHPKAILLSALALCLLPGCQNNAETESSLDSNSIETSALDTSEDTTSNGDASMVVTSLEDASEVLTFESEFALEAGNVGYFSLGLSSPGYYFIEEFDESMYASFTFGAAFSDLEIYAISNYGDGTIGIVTIGELTTGYDYGTFSGSNILTVGGEFELMIPIRDAYLTSEGMFYSTRSENSVTVTLENAAFHSELTQDDIVLSGGLSGATYTITPVEDTGFEILEHDAFKQMYQSVVITFSNVLGPEEYGIITVKDSASTYNEDLSISFDFYRKGAQLLTDIVTFDLKDTLVFAFANLSINTELEVGDISVSGALEGTRIDALEIIDYLDYGKAIALEVTYPSSFFEDAISSEILDLTGAFIFSSNTNVEGEELTVYCSVPGPEFEEEYSFDESTNTITTNLSFENGYFNKDLTASDFSYDEGTTDLEISNAILTLNSTYNELEFSCVLPSSFDHGFLDLTISNLFVMSYSFEDKSSTYTFDTIQYVA